LPVGGRSEEHRPQAAGSIEPSARDLVTTAMETLKLSAPGYHRVLRVARTIADLGGSDVVAEPHVAEALRFRPR
jgi:magnesium chelatase family protein